MKSNAIPLVGLLLNSILCLLPEYVFSHQCNMDTNCRAEIVFVMDSSGSVGSSGWNEEVSFVKGIIDGVGGHSHFGVVEFSSDTSTIYSLCDDQTDCDVMDTAIDAFSYSDGGTDIPLGIQEGIDMFTSCGDNPNELDNVMVLITDGYGGDPCTTSMLISLASLEIKVFLVKVGNGIGNTVIDCLVNDATTDIFEVNDFSDISGLINELTETVCIEPCELDLGQCNNDPCDCSELTNCNICHDNGCDECDDGYFKLDFDYKCISCLDTFGEGCLFCQDFNGCGQCADGYTRVLLDSCGVYGCEGPIITGDECDECVVLAIDESGSISDSEFDMEQQFATNVIDLFDSNADIGIVAFASNARDIFVLGSGTPTDASNAVLSIVQTNGGTNYNDAIDSALLQFNNNCDSNKPRIFLLISDGQPNTSPCSKKTELDASSITTVIVGIGDGFNADSSDITCLVDDTSSQIFEVSDFTNDALNSILENLRNSICPEVVCPNGVTDSSLDIDDASGCSIQCVNSPCSCTELCFCDECHENGCNQCQDGYFKKDYNHPCIQCQEMFGDGCMFCQDFDGCGQCAQGYSRQYNSECGLFECV